MPAVEDLQMIADAEKLQLRVESQYFLVIEVGGSDAQENRE